uniref:Uncharacterized protein n=1 Tax=viral metagenome TaxID=1070528 RepID=A0A6C0HGW8_9ZZZZ
MKPITRNLKLFIDKNCSSPYNEIERTFRFSSSQSSIFQNIHELIRDAHIEWFNAPNPVLEIDPIQQGQLYNDIPENFIRIIETTLSQQKTFQMNIGGRDIFVAFYADKHKSHSAKRWNEYLKKIFIWLTVISQFASTACVKTLYVYIYLTHEKKQLPADPSTALGRTHANTAFTTSCTSNTEIHLYREEEWFKVFIHETFHSYGLDFSTMDNSPANQKIREIFGISADVRLYESYTEIWAEIIHICFLVHFQMVNAPKWENVDNFIAKIRDILIYEITFSLLQCAKVLKHSGLTYEDIAKQDAASKQKISRLYKEETPLFSYYIVKSVLLFFANDFVEWTMIHNRGSFNFQKTQQNVDAYIQFIQKHSKNPKYTKTMKMMEECLNHSSQNSVLKNEPGLNSMRMTLHED